MDRKVQQIPRLSPLDKEINRDFPDQHQQLLLPQLFPRTGVAGPGLNGICNPISMSSSRNAGKCFRTPVLEFLEIFAGMGVFPSPGKGREAVEVLDLIPGDPGCDPCPQTLEQNSSPCCWVFRTRRKTRFSKIREFWHKAEQKWIKFWDSLILWFWILGLCSSGILGFWDFVILGFCSSGILGLWDSDILRFCGSGILWF